MGYIINHNAARYNWEAIQLVALHFMALNDKRAPSLPSLRVVVVETTSPCEIIALRDHLGCRPRPARHIERYGGCRSASYLCILPLRISLILSR
jgi:hypothetical protein